MGARGASAHLRDVGSHLAGRRTAMIAKTFLLAKTFRVYGTNFLRQEKSLRDHKAAPLKLACFWSGLRAAGLPGWGA